MTLSGVITCRRGDARALATFIPDCIVLVTRLARDPRVVERKKYGKMKARRSFQFSKR